MKKFLTLFFVAVLGGFVAIGINYYFCLLTIREVRTYR